MNDQSPECILMQPPDVCGQVADSSGQTSTKLPGAMHNAKPRTGKLVTQRPCSAERGAVHVDVCPSPPAGASACASTRFQPWHLDSRGSHRDSGDDSEGDDDAASLITRGSSVLCVPKSPEKIARTGGQGRPLVGSWGVGAQGGHMDVSEGAKQRREERLRQHWQDKLDSYTQRADSIGKAQQDSSRAAAMLCEGAAGSPLPVPITAYAIAESVQPRPYSPLPSGLSGKPQAFDLLSKAPASPGSAASSRLSLQLFLPPAQPVLDLEDLGEGLQSCASSLSSTSHDSAYSPSPRLSKPKPPIVHANTRAKPVAVSKPSRRPPKKAPPKLASTNKTMAHTEDTRPPSSGQDTSQDQDQDQEGAEEAKMGGVELRRYRAVEGAACSVDPVEALGLVSRAAPQPWSAPPLGTNRSALHSSFDMRPTHSALQRAWRVGSFVAYEGLAIRPLTGRHQTPQPLPPPCALPPLTRPSPTSSLCRRSHCSSQTRRRSTNSKKPSYTS